MAKDIGALLPTQYQKATWQRLLDCLAPPRNYRYAKGQQMLLARELLKDRYDLTQINIERFLITLNNPRVNGMFTAEYEENAIKSLIEIGERLLQDKLGEKYQPKSALTYKDFLVKKEAYYRSAILAIFKELIKADKFFHIATIALLLQHKKHDDMTPEERAVHDAFYSPEGNAFFNQYLKQNESDTCKKAFQTRDSLYAHPDRSPFKVLMGRFHTKLNLEFLIVVSELQGIYKDAIFARPANIADTWRFLAEKLPLVMEDPAISSAIGLPIPAALLKFSADDTSPGLLMHLVKQDMKPFLDKCEDLALTKFEEWLCFDDLEAAIIAVRVLQLKLIIMSKDSFSSEQAVFEAAKKTHTLIRLQCDLAYRAFDLYPATGRLLVGFVTRNSAFVMDHLARLKLNGEAFFKAYPEFEQTPFWRIIFFADRVQRSQMHYELLKIACDYVALSGTDEAIAVELDGHNKELHFAGVPPIQLQFFSIRNAGCDRAEQLEAHYRLGLEEARARKIRHEPEEQSCRKALSC